MTHFSSLLLAVDASPYAEAAARYAARLSERLGLPLRAVHVLDLRVATTPSSLDAGMGDPAMLTPHFDVELQGVLERRAEKVQVDIQALLKGLGLETDVELPTGPVENEILSRADAETLILMGKEGDSAEINGSGRLGSVAEHVARRAEGAVLLAPQTFSEPQRLLLGYDGSDGSEGALAYTLALAKPLKLPILALNVQDDEETARAPLVRARSHAERKGLNLTADFRSGDPAKAIVETAQDGDVIAIGAFETGRIAAFFQGSTTLEIAREAAVPILLHH